MFSVKKYEQRMNENDDNNTMSVPFGKKRKTEESDSIEAQEIEQKTDKTSKTDNVCSKNTNKRSDIQFVDEEYNNLYNTHVKQMLENADNVLKCIENEIQKNKTTDKYEFYCILLAKHAIQQNENAYEIVKKYYKTTTEKMFAEVIATIENNKTTNKEGHEHIYKLYYKTYKSKTAYEKLVRYNIVHKNDNESVYTSEYKHIAIPLFYELVPNEARVRTEKILQNDYNAWKTYIETETKQQNASTTEYIRNLYKRAVESKFSTNDTKDMFKKWLEFEKKNNGDCETVKNKAREYVESINKA